MTSMVSLKKVSRGEYIGAILGHVCMLGLDSFYSVCMLLPPLGFFPLHNGSTYGNDKISFQICEFLSVL